VGHGKTGKPWRGIVKNRAKNGDFYWVEAYVTPITEHGRIVGYMSVRSQPKRQDVDAAAALYRQVMDKQASLPSTLQRYARQSDVLKVAPFCAGTAGGHGVVLFAGFIAMVA
jgi:aerotaxis receptor